MLAMDDREDEHVPVEIEKLADSSSTVNTGDTEKAMAHEDENEHVPIDMKKLADSLSGKLETLPPLSGKCSIYRMVSIGPFHHGKEELKAMEEHKQRDDIVGYLPIQENLLEINFSKAKHFVDLLILCLQPSQSRAVIALKDLNIPSVKKLDQAGIKFKRGSSKDLLDIKFNEGILEIPFLRVDETTERLYRNVLAFENMHCYTGYFNDYILMMNYLVSTPKDAELLLQNEIIGLGDTEAVPTVFRNLGKDCAIYYFHFQYSAVLANLQAYCKSHKLKATFKQNYLTLKQNYCNTLWASISVIAAVILLLLTFIQTVCSLIAL
ncbi:DUF862 domain-containing protein [Citrus sinensis]|nr:DUF862 domain-containing protein [Citrus sinensis]